MQIKKKHAKGGSKMLMVLQIPTKLLPDITEVTNVKAESQNSFLACA